MMADFETILLNSDQRGIATLTLNRPDKHNALNAQMIAELTAAAHLLSRDADIRVVVLAAAGSSFCAGGDLGWMQDQAGKDRAGKIRGSQALAGMLAALNALPKPLIGRVQGPAFGGGVGLVSICDVAVAAAGTQFGLTETRLGLIPATIGPFLVRRVGEGFARQMFFTGRGFDTDLALRSGLIARACAAAELDRCVEAEILPVLQCAPGAVADAKAFCLSIGGQAPVDLFEQSSQILADRWESEEAQTGIKAFFARNDPPWIA